MTMGIEHFRSIVTDKTDLESRRVRLGENDQGQTVVNAPKSLWSRFISWVHRKDAPNPEGVKEQQNKAVREAFYQALEKSEGPVFAQKLIKAVFGENYNTEANLAKPLRAHKIQQVLNLAQVARSYYQAQNDKLVSHYLSPYGNLSTTVDTLAKSKSSTLGYPGLKPDDKDVQRAFRDLVKSHPEYRHEVLSPAVLNTLAEQAVQKACEAKMARFREQYPHLDRIDTGHFHGTEAFFDGVKRDLQVENEPEDLILVLDDMGAPLPNLKDKSGPPLSLVGDIDRELKDWMQKSLSGIEDTSKVLARMEFDPQSAHALLGEALSAKQRLQELEQAPQPQFAKVEKQLVREIAKHVMQELPPYFENNVDGNTWLSAKVGEYLDMAAVSLGSTESLADPAMRAHAVEYVRDLLVTDLVNYELGQLNDVDDNVKKDVQTLVEQKVKLITDALDKGLREDTGLQALSQCKKQAVPLRDALAREIGQQVSHLNAKIGAINQYLRNDPLSEKSLLFDKLAWLTAGEIALTEHLENLKAALDTENNPRKKRQIEADIKTLEQALRNLSVDIKQTSQDWQSANPSREGANPEDLMRQDENFKLDLIRKRELETSKKSLNYDTDSEDSDIVDRGRRDISEDRDLSKSNSDLSQLDVGTLRAQVKTNRSEGIDRIQSILEGLWISPGKAGKLLDQNRDKALQQLHEQQYDIIERRMVATRDGVSRTYMSTLIPDSKISEGLNVYRQRRQDGDNKLEDNQDQNLILEQDLNIDLNAPPEEWKHAPHLQLSELHQVIPHDRTKGHQDEFILKSQIIRHSVLNTWDIEDPDTRRGVAQEQAKEIVVVGLNLAPQKFLQTVNDKNPPPKMVHVSLNLSTSDPSGRHLDRGESEFVQHQLDAFAGENVVGVQTIPVEIEKEIHDVTVDVDTITFSFAVSGEKVNSSRFEQHDRANLIKLVGDLTVGTAPGGYVGGVIDELVAQRDNPDLDPPLTDDERNRIDDVIAKLRREVDTARDMFNKGLYKGDLSGARNEAQARFLSDTHRMVRSITSVVDLTGQANGLLRDQNMHMSMSENCRNNIDGAGIGDVEHKAQLIVNDMGGNMRPGEQLSDEDRIIYNTVLTSSGELESQRFTTGYQGMRDIDDIRYRCFDPDALDYARGLAPQPEQRR